MAWREGKDESLSEALAGVIDAGQQVIGDRIDLMRLEAEDALRRSALAAALIGLGALFALGGFGLAVAAAILALEGVLPLPVTLGLMALVHGIAALVIVMRAKRNDVRWTSARQQERQAASARALDRVYAHQPDENQVEERIRYESRQHV